MPKLGLGTGIGRSVITTPGIVTDNLVMKHMYPAGAVEPLSDGAAYFDGASDYINTNATFQATLRDSFSICMWIKPNDGQPGSAEYLVGARNSSSEDIMHFSLLTDGKLYLYLKSNNDAGALTSSVIFSNGVQEWTHVAATALKDEGESNGFKIYINGVLTSQANSSPVSDANWGAFTTDINLDLGAYNAADSHSDSLDGYMSNAGIFSAVLTPSQIKSIMWKQYADLTSSETANLVSWWALDEGTGTTATDSHGSNNGSATGF